MSNGVLYWIYFKDISDIFAYNHEQKIGLRVSEGESVENVFYNYWKSFDSNELKIINYEIAPEWLQKEN